MSVIQAEVSYSTRAKSQSFRVTRIVCTMIIWADAWFLLTAQASCPVACVQQAHLGGVCKPLLCSACIFSRARLPDGVCFPSACLCLTQILCTIMLLQRLLNSLLLQRLLNSILQAPGVRREICSNARRQDCGQAV